MSVRDVCVVPDPIPTAASVRTVVAEKGMDRFVLDLVECPSISRTSAMAQTFRPAVSEEYSPVVFAGGGGGGEVAAGHPDTCSPASALNVVCGSLFSKPCRTRIAPLDRDKCSLQAVK